MKLVLELVFLAFCLAVGVDSVSLSLSSNLLTLSGNAHIQFNEPRETIWAALSNGHRYPIINSGDTIALRLAYTSGNASQYWLAAGSSYCYTSSKPGSIMTPSKWSSSSYIKFKITAMGKMDGQPINSGDTVSLSSLDHGAMYRLRCYTSSSTRCRVESTVSQMTGNHWLRYIHVTFQIFSRDAVDGSPLQYGDVVGFKYPYAGSSAWLYYYGSRFYARNCSYNDKAACAKENAPTGFRIFKKL